MLPTAADPAAAVQLALSDPPAYWPTDREVREAVLMRPFYLNGRQHQRRLILDRLEETFDAPEPVGLDKAAISIEHILPQTMTDEWRYHLEQLGDV